MIITEIIQQLEEIKEKHGDIECVLEIFDMDKGYEIMPVEEISVGRREIVNTNPRGAYLKREKCALFLI